VSDPEYWPSIDLERVETALAEAGLSGYAPDAVGRLADERDAALHKLAEAERAPHCATCRCAPGRP
jgi:hypothetical protein